MKSAEKDAMVMHQHIRVGLSQKTPEHLHGICSHETL